MKKLAKIAGVVLMALTGSASAYEAFQNMAYMNYPPVWLRGNFNNWAKTPLILGTAYKYNGYTSVGYVNVPAGTQTFKFDVSAAGDWSSNYGDNYAGDACLDAGGANLAFAQGAGTYEVRYNTGVSGYGCGRPFYSTQKLNSYTSTTRSMYLRTDVTNWSALPMVLVKDNVWEAPITVSPNSFYQMKFDVHGDWSVNFGRPAGSDPRAYLNAGTASQNGENIRFYVEDYSGEPNVTGYLRFNAQTKEYALCPNSGKALCQ